MASGLGAGRAQDSLRFSQAGQDFAEARQQALMAGRYNVQSGDFRARFGAGLGLELNDNVRYEAEADSPDLILRPRGNVFAFWPFTDRNSLNLALDLGYSKYLENSDLDRMYITPGSQLGFDFYLGDFIVNVHDRFAFVQEVATDPTAAGVASLDRLENTLGVFTTWDQNEAVFSVGYDHLWYIPTEDRYEYLRRDSDILFGQAGFRVHPTFWTGVEVGGSFSDYDLNVYGDTQQANAGAFVTLQSSEYLSLKVRGGYVITFVDPSLFLPQEGSQDGWYLDLRMQHRVNPRLNYSLSLGREFSTGLQTAQLLDLYFVRLGVTWSLLRKMPFTTSLQYENGRDLQQFIPEKFQRWGVGIGVRRQLAQRLDGGVAYDFLVRDSDLPQRDYTQNRLVFSLSYRF